MTEHESIVRKFFASRWYVFIGAAVAAVLLFSYVRAFYQSYQIDREIARLQAEKERLSSTYLKTVEVLKYVQTQGYVEGKARVELGLVKPGEHAAIVQGERAEADARQAQKPMIQSTSNPTRWWVYFFGNH